MHIAVGYGWSPTTAGYHLERALRETDHKITYVGLAQTNRRGYPEASPIDQVIGGLSEQPDIFLWIDFGLYFPREIEKLPIPTICYLIDVHLGTWRQEAAKFFDAVFIAQRDYLETYRRVLGHKQVYWLPLAAAPDVHRQMDLPRIYDVGFVGNIARAHKKTARVRCLELLADNFTTNDFFRPYTPEEVGRVYSQSRIVFNTSIAGDVTMRVFEGTACGALMLTDSTANSLETLFEIDKELVVFEDDTDLLEKVTYYLSHEEERTQIALAGYQRTHNEHAYAHRAQKILETVSQPDFKVLAPMRQARQRERFTARREVYTHLHMLDAIFDEARAAGYNPFQRAAAIWPCLIRRLMI